MAALKGVRFFYLDIAGLALSRPAGFLKQYIFMPFFFL